MSRRVSARRHSVSPQVVSTHTSSAVHGDASTCITRQGLEGGALRQLWLCPIFAATPLAKCRKRVGSQLLAQRQWGGACS